MIPGIARAVARSASGAGVSIPAGATRSNIVVSARGYAVKRLRFNKSQRRLKNVAAVLDMQPDGYQFAQPVTLTMPINLTAVAEEEANGNSLQMAFLNTSTGLWELMQGAVDRQTGIMSVETTHFSIWTAMSVPAPDTETPTPTPDPDGPRGSVGESEDSKDDDGDDKKWLGIGLAIGAVVLSIILIAVAFMYNKKQKANLLASQGTHADIAYDKRDLEVAPGEPATLPVQQVQLDMPAASSPAMPNPFPPAEAPTAPDPETHFGGVLTEQGGLDALQGEAPEGSDESPYLQQPAMHAPALQSALGFQAPGFQAPEA
eukprot:3464361-Rhodomonas_salina.1